MPGASVDAAPVRVAVVGSGLTGLAAAYFLTNELRQLHERPGGAPQQEQEQRTDDDRPAHGPPKRVRVELFERAPRLGMDASSISVIDPSSQKSIRLDVPMRAYNRGYYPELLTLYRRINIPGKRSNFSFSFATAAATASASASASASAPEPSTSGPLPPRAPAPTFVYLGSSGAKGVRMPTIFRRAIPSFRMLDARHAWSGLVSVTTFVHLFLVYFIGYACFLFPCLYHSWLGHTRDPSHPLATTTLAEWARSSRLSRRFLYDILVPILSAAQTAPDTAILAQPCAEVLEFTALAFGVSNYRVATGVHAVVTALTARMDPDTLHLNSTIVEMRPSPTRAGAVLLKVSQAAEDGQQSPTVSEHDGYDYVIFALQANQTARILRDYEAVLATDRTVAFDKRQQRHREHLRDVITNLEHFFYERSVVINHTDTRMLPPEGDRCDLNLISPARSSSQLASADNYIQRGDAHITSDEEDEGAVDLYLRNGAHRSNGNGSNGSAQPAFDPLLIAPEGCTMATHLIHHYTRPITSSSPSSSPQPNPSSPDARFPDLPLLAHGRQEQAIPSSKNGHANGHAAHHSTHGNARAVHEVHGQPSNGAGQMQPASKNGNASATPSTEEEEESVLFMQTTNPIAPYLPRPELTLSISHFERVVPTLRAKAAQAHFFRWAKTGGGGGGGSQAGASMAPALVPGGADEKQEEEENNRAGKAMVLPARLARQAAAALVAPIRSPRSQWKVQLGDLQRLSPTPASKEEEEEEESGDGGGADVARGGPGLLVAGSWGPPAIPLLEGCVASARLVVSEILEREGLYSPVCDELAVNAM
ncbi:hypothetical protein OC834_002711 [Tilletia horrida]|nr:hypothetical protein OC834_002711 [Tilletia horrida]